MSDAMTYPPIQELFALLESDLEREIDRQNLVLDFEPKQI
jgi:hypothetical protein